MRPCSIVGNVGRTPEMRYTPNGKAVTNFSLAMYGGRAEDDQPITTWVRVACWKDLAEAVAAKVSKGDKLVCEGYLLPIRTFERTDGSLGSSLEFTAFSVKALQWSPQDLAELPELSQQDLEAEAPEEIPTD